MKILILMYSFIRKNIIPIFIIIAIMTVVLFLAVSLYGQYKHYTATKEFYIKANLKDDVYFTLMHHGDPEVYTPLINEIVHNLESYSGFNKIIQYNASYIGYNSMPANVYYYNNDMLNHFKSDIKQGRWLSSNSVDIEVVLGGSIFSEVSVGDKIDLGNGITAKVVGKLNDIFLYPSFTSFSTNLSSNKMFKIAYETAIVYINKESIKPDIYNNIDMTVPLSNFFISFKENITQTEKDEIINYLETYGLCNDYDTIIKNSNAEIDYWVRMAFPFPLFIITILTLSIICVSAVIIKRSMNEQSKYYLIGCTKKRSIALIISTLTILFSIPCIINIICAVFFPNFLRQTNPHTIDYILDISCVYPVFIYLIFIIAILTIMPIAFYHKHSPLSFYRRNL